MKRTDRVLITGVSGFVGSHLAEELSGRCVLFGMDIADNPENTASIKDLNFMKCDLLDCAAVDEAMRNLKPDRVFHLAGQSAPSLSFADPAATMRINIFSALNLFESLAKYSPDAQIVNIGSGDEYGAIRPDELPVREDAELRPGNPYAVSKAAQDMLAYQYRLTRGLKIVRCRPFNHIGPRQAPNFAPSAFAKQIAEIEAGKTAGNAVLVGNLDAQRDFLDVRDVASAYETLSEKGDVETVYNICSGRPVKIGRILEILISESKVPVMITEDPSRMRPTDTPVIYGDASRIKKLGWSPKYAIEDTLRSTLDYWRGKV